jgi:cyclohexadieny/prephenate dehydrogenase
VVDPDFGPLAAPLFKRLTIIGAGLIGSSIVRVARQRRLAGEVVVTDNSPAVLERVRQLGIADQVIEDPAEAVNGSDLVISCVPVGANAAVGRAIAPTLSRGAIVSDVGSVKSAVVDALAPVLPRHVHLVPAHPVAGTEYSGPDAGFSTLFRNRWCIVTPPEDAVAETMTAAHHDLVLAITSHVPHLIAYNIVGTAADLEEVTQSEVIKFSAGGFRDFTRIAASDPTMWRDIFLNNKEAVLEMLGRFNEDLAALQRMIRWGDGQGLFELFTRTRAIRRSIIEQGQETVAPDFGRGGPTSN